MASMNSVDMILADHLLGSIHLGLRSPIVDHTIHSAGLCSMTRSQKKSTGSGSTPTPTSGIVQREVFDSLFVEFQEPLQRYLYMLTGNAAMAEDLAQACFLRLNQEFSAGRTVETIKAWLFRTGHNLAMDHHRRRLRSNEREWEEDAMPIADHGESAPDVIMAQERTVLI